MRENTLPAVFAGLSGKVSYVRQVSQTEWSSSCPQCGGVPHKNGVFPDRFRMWTNANGKNKILGWCRRCGYVWFPDGGKPIDPLEFERWRREQLEIERQKKADAERAIAVLQSQKPWIAYHDRLTQWALEVLATRGITKEYADYWQLGFNPDYVVNGLYHSPALTIPLWQGDDTVANVKLRVLNPKTDDDRYRALFKVGTAFPFVAWQNQESDTCLIVEGEFKAMVCAEFLNQRYQVVGMPSKSPGQEVIDTVAKFDKVVVCLDPDAAIEDAKGNSAKKRIIDMLPNKSISYADLPAKIDDMIVWNGLKVDDVMKYARTIK